MFDQDHTMRDNLLDQYQQPVDMLELQLEYFVIQHTRDQLMSTLLNS